MQPITPQGISHPMTNTDRKRIYKMIYITVADLTFGIKTRKQEAMLQRMAYSYAPFMETGEPDDRPTIFTVDIDSRITLPDTPPLTRFDYDLTEDSASLRIYSDCYILSIRHSASGHTFSLRCPMAGDRTNDCTADITIQGIAPPEHILDHLLILAASVRGIAHGMLLIHASTIVYHGKAVMFLAESGTGKSTHSRMWLESIPGAQLLNDDAPALRVNDNGSVTAYGTPWSGKTPCYRNESYPLAAMVRIRRAPSNEIRRLDTLHSFGAVLPSCLPTLQQEERMLDRLCDVLSPVVAAVPVYMLDCLPDHDAARTSCNAIFGTCMP